MTNQQLHERRSQVIAQGMGALYPLYVEKAENAYVWDIEGNKYIDFAAGIAVTNTGHSHKRISEAVKLSWITSRTRVRWLRRMRHSLSWQKS